jgi:hypothetical protein
VTKGLPFTKNGVRRAVTGAREAGVRVAGVRVSPDGTITVLDEMALPNVAPLVPSSSDDAEAENWSNA